MCFVIGFCFLLGGRFNGRMFVIFFKLYECKNSKIEGFNCCFCVFEEEVGIYLCKRRSKIFIILAIVGVISNWGFNIIFFSITL